MINNFLTKTLCSDRGKHFLNLSTSTPRYILILLMFVQCMRTRICYIRKTSVNAKYIFTTGEDALISYVVSELISQTFFFSGNKNFGRYKMNFLMEIL